MGFFLRLKARLSRRKGFLRDESGMTLPLLAISLVVITSMVGLAIDVARVQLVQSNLQFSLDAAGLAAGATVSTESLNSEVTKYLNANFNGYLGATVTAITVTADSTNTVINVTAQATLPSTFMKVAGINQMTVHASTQISRAVTGLELAMVLDNTGSMVDDGKLTALKSAATTLVQTLYGGQTTVPNLWIGLVPFSQAVNIGTASPQQAWIRSGFDDVQQTWPAGVNWAGCVEARENNNMDVTDDPPSSDDPASLFYVYNNYCPSGQVWNAAATACVSACSNGFTWNGSTCACTGNNHVVGSSCVSDCGANQTWTGSSCVCNSGYTMSGSTCVANCSNGYSWNGTSCYCATGKHVSGSSCVANCGANQTWNTSTSTCVCNSGYTMSGSTCVARCGANQTWNGSACVCNYGYKLSGSSCVAQCSNGFSWNGSSCVCNSPNHVSGSSCISGPD